MGKFNNEALVKEIKRRLSIINLVESYTSVKKTGKGYVGLCPFHDDSNPSMHVDEEKGLFHCFSCGAGGDIFGFYMRYNNLTFPEAFSELAKKADVNIERQPESVPRRSQNSVLYKINAVAAKYYRHILQENSKGKRGRDYLERRGISSETAKEFIFGFAPEGWDNLVKYLTKNEVPLNIAEKVGLIVKRNNTEGYYDRFRNRLMFPICNVEGKVIGFGGRRVDEQDEPKYINSPESDIYHKRKSFYGINKSKDHIRREGRAVLVEGYTDCVAMISHGYKNTVATLGTACTIVPLKLLARYIKVLHVVYDGDDAGHKAILRLTKLCWDVNLELQIITLPKKDDPASFLQAGKSISDLVEKSCDIFTFFVNALGGQFWKVSLAEKVRLCENIVNVIGKINDRFKQDLLLQQAARIMQMPLESLTSLLRSNKPAREMVVVEKEQVMRPFERVPLIEQQITSLIVNSISRPERLRIESDLFPYLSPFMQKIIKKVEDFESFDLFLNSFESSMVRDWIL
ncbi:MAG: DNA primase, partial [Candidatus Dadabacteria bacterium]|nr:DNA primase [Candidatus Dadabacteria bacterium]